MKQISKYLFVSLIALWGCNGGDPVQQVSGKEYFPLRTGFYQIYSIQEKIYTELSPPEEFMYELKTEVVDSFANQEGGFTFVIYRSKRSSDGDPWVFEESWSARVNTKQVVSIEGNTPFIRIALPAFEHKEWNGNALNAQAEDIYWIEQAGIPYSLNAELKFEDALVIRQEEEINNLFRDEREEVYAPHVGLIYKKSVVLNYCDEVSCFGQQIINDGMEYVQVLKEYGQN